MGTSTDGEISYGVVCDEDTEFPWEDDIEEWWMSVKGFKDIYEPFDGGEYADGWSEKDPRFEEYDQHRRDWKKQNPLPVELVNYCSGGYPMYVLAVPGVGMSYSRGYPTFIHPEELKIPDLDKFIGFLEQYDIPYVDGPGWVLTSYWG